MSRSVWISVLVLVALVACHNEVQKREPVAIGDHAAEEEKEYVLLDLLDLPLSEITSSEIVEVQQDHSLQKKSRYEGYPLHPVLDYIVDSLNLNIEQGVITFQCDDGYLATSSLRDLYSRDDGFIAFDDLDIDGKKWSDEMEAKYAPFYLVWEDIPYNEHKIVWPYGWSKMRVIESDPYVNLKPKDRPDLTEGFSHYKTHCLKCHAINKIGGEMGPDFNHPKNITTYWQRKHIIAYARNPSSYRWNTKMYNIDLTEKELNQVVDYLEYMQENPIAEL